MYKCALRNLCKIGDAPLIWDTFWLGKLESPIKIWPEAPAYKPWFFGCENKGFILACIKHAIKDL